MNDFDDLHRSLLENLQEGVYFTDTNRTIRYWNSGAQQITGYTPEDVVGRCCADNILAHVDAQGAALCFSDCPLVESIRSGRQLEKEVFLHHKNGHRVPVLVRVSPIRDKEGQVVGAVESFTDNSNRLEVLQRMEELQRIAYLDTLTGVGNRTYGEIVVRSRLEELKRYGWPFGVLFADVDGLKQVNDTLGHETGDELLSLVARTLVANVRSPDLVARWGGDEFLVVVANVDRESLISLADKLRSLVASCRLPDRDTAISMSVGLAIANVTDSLKSLIKRADQLLYRSKTLGRNRVCAEEPCATERE